MEAQKAQATLKDLIRKHEQILAQKLHNKNFQELDRKQQTRISWLAMFYAEEELNNIIRGE